jgi:hypothetical protein
LIIVLLDNDDIILSNYLTGRFIRHFTLSIQEAKNKMLFGLALLPFVMLERPFFIYYIN